MAKSRRAAGGGGVNPCPRIILIVCDTLRKDALRLYGGPAKTPALERLAEDSMVYHDAIAPAPWTFPSHVSMFTGLYPSEHGVHEDRNVKTEGCIKLNERLSAGLLAHALSEKGYRTIGVSNNITVSRFTHFDKGFDSFMNVDVDPWTSKKEIEKLRLFGATIPEIFVRLFAEGRLDDAARYAGEFIRIKSLAKAINFPLDKGSSETNRLLLSSKFPEKFFMFINFLEMHEPYRHESRKERWDHYTDTRPMAASSLKKLWADYIEETEYLDKGVGALLGMLKDRGLYDDSLIIVTSDHGQAFNEHGFLYHNIYLYDELVRVPLIIKYPKGRKFKKKAGYQSLVNLPRLILDIIDGKDDGAMTSNTAFSESFGDIHTKQLMPKTYRGRIPYLISKYEKHRKAVYRNGFKLTVNGTDGIVEEFLKDGKPVDRSHHRKAFSDLSRALKSFSGDPKFKVPSTTS